jgi:hypothetical protein
METNYIDPAEDGTHPLVLSVAVGSNSVISCLLGRPLALYSQRHQKCAHRRVVHAAFEQ